MLKNIIIIAQMVLSVLLIIVILLQQKGAGLGAAFGGSSNVYSTRRGVDKILFQITIVLVVLFFATAIAILLV
ncbi:MAG: Preprotein translocase, SecG subunit [Candidatus Magasanikbacteria bacterium GW2011_GWC2_37_14]|uniref:Protein-export membrane protein SecG n=1 Tax=Candidatus Magasanikbacteria bacterium GW2011_GWC2_37_14 TaxID=1619046 RepID=A0A0G0IUV3_9BACT|nr:MAG: Preprotein translocase, SecG subunit [Candidatus Magasanikbacteria bacterium GW2011_GWC2_37_14]